MNSFILNLVSLIKSLFVKSKSKGNSLDTISGKNEKKIEDFVFTENIFFFWRKSRFSLTNKKLTGQIPSTVLWIIPAGKYEIVHPVKSISSVGCKTTVHHKRFIFGILLLFFAVVIHSFESLVIYGVAASAFLLNSFTTKCEVFTNTARPQEFEVSILEREEVKKFVKRIITLITE
jgi:hypothetical protein